MSKFFYWATRVVVVAVILKWIGIFDIETVIPKISNLVGKTTDS